MNSFELKKNKKIYKYMYIVFNVWKLCNMLFLKMKVDRIIINKFNNICILFIIGRFILFRKVLFLCIWYINCWVIFGVFIVGFFVFFIDII